MVTIAPERDGALAAIRRIVDAGVVAAVGHTEATYEQTRGGDRCRRDGGHHLFNAMRRSTPASRARYIALLKIRASRSN